MEQEPGVLPAKWQEKGKKDRAKGAGCWVCPKCGERLTTLMFNHIDSSHQYGRLPHSVVLVLQPGVDYQSSRGRVQLYNGDLAKDRRYFAATARGATRLTQAQQDKAHIQSLIDFNNATNNIKREAIYMGKMAAIRNIKPEDARTCVLIGQLPVAIKCTRAGCRCVATVEKMAEGNAALKIEKMHEGFEPTDFLSRRLPRFEDYKK